jgi:hypothetical protein
MRRIHWRALAAVTGGLVCVSAALGGAALAAPAAGGVKGNPQPELKPFKISSAGYGGAASVAIEPNGSLVVAYGTTSGEGKIVVCMLNRGAKQCAHSVTLSPLDDDDMFDAPQVFIPSANHVVVLMNTCCDDAANGDNLVFSSTNGGRTFATPVRVGSGVGTSVAALVGGQIIFSSGDDRDGAQVESIPVNPSGPPAEIATANAKVAYDIGVGGYKGGALVGSDYDGTTSYTTYVEYAPKGKDFDASGSYHSVGSFPNETLVAMSGDALLTQQTSGQEYLKLRLFNGTKFGTAHLVPGTGGGGPGWFALDQDPSGRVHVFTDRAFAPIGYDLYERSTATGGATWNSPVNLGNAIDSDYFGIALDSNSSGLVVGSDRGQVTEGYPVLGPQGASFSLKASAIKKGHTTTASGKGSPVAKGRVVSLQVERSGLWYTIATTHENGSGGFSFTIKGTATGTHSYRAVVSDYAGYREYGYSAARSLKVS